MVAKFYAEPTGWKRDYDPVKSMEREFWTLKKVERIVNVPRPVGMRKDFSCALVTEYVHGRPLFMYMRTENGLYDKLTAMAHTLRKSTKIQCRNIASRMNFPIFIRYWISSG